jgi:hypothetical protein
VVAEFDEVVVVEITVKNFFGLFGPDECRQAFGHS